MSETTISNVGPIESISIPVPEGGGVVVFRGRNGSGKSIALAAIDSAVTGKGRVPVRDGQLKGEVEAHGITMTIGRSTRRKGEAEVHSLEGKLSIADLVDPGIKDPEAADAARIKSLVNLLGPGPNADLFDTGGVELTPATLDATDLVDMASRVKRELEAKAREYEAAAENAQREACTSEATIGDDDPAWAKPVEEADGAMEQAMLERAELSGRAMAAIQASKRADKAREQLTMIGTGPTVTEATAERDKAIDAVHEAEKELALTSSYAANCDRLLDNATEAHTIIEGCRLDMKEAEEAATITDNQIAEAESAVETARAASIKAASGRRAKTWTDRMQSHLATQLDNEAKAETMRDAARDTDEVLSRVIRDAGCHLSVTPINQRMRLVTDTDRGVTPFGELSPGERWRIALDIAAQALGEGGELTIPQEAWESLDPENRRAIAEHVQRLGIVAYTAECSDGPLRAESAS